MIETRHLKNVVIFIQTILSFVLSRKRQFFALFLFIFHERSRRLDSNNFRNSGYKGKTAGSAHVSRLSLPFLRNTYFDISYRKHFLHKLIL